MNVKPLTILLAEDNHDHAELIIDTLEEFHLGNKIVHVTNGEDALKYLTELHVDEDGQTMKPDLVLLDLKMPRLDGIGTLRAIRQRTELQTLPVIVVSTSSTDKDVNECYELGANSYITKPIQFEEFTRKIRELNLYWVLTSELPRR